MNRLGEILEERGITQKAFADSLNIDAPLLNKIKQGHCNPIPADAHRIANVLDEPLTRIWHPSDLDYGVSPARQKNSAESVASIKKDLRSKVTVRKCFRVPKSTDEWFTIDKLRVCGYSSYQSWFDACVRRFKGEYGAICKARAVPAVQERTTA